MKIKHLCIAILLASLSFSAHAQSNNNRLDELVSKKRAYNDTAKNGFCIQLYNGNETSATKIIEEFREFFPDIKVKRIYKVPEWKIQTYIYKTRREADQILNIIKNEYPGARVL